jgi:hypothetical protein
MARVAFGCTLGAALGPTGEGRFSSVSGAVAPSTTAATKADTDAGTASGTLTTNVAAAVAVLVADGASPTQAHVTTLNTAWGLLATAIATAKTSTAAAVTAAAQANVVLDIDTAVVTTQNGVRHAMRNLLRTIEGSGLPP